MESGKRDRPNRTPRNIRILQGNRYGIGLNIVADEERIDRAAIERVHGILLDNKPYLLKAAKVQNEKDMNTPIYP